MIDRRDGVKRPPEKYAPSLLLSYHYYHNCSEVIKDYQYRDWVLDSGAFSAMNSGTSISLEKYILFCKDILASDTPPIEIFALDVIGDAAASLRNTEKMWEAGIQAIPTYHIGEPKSYLTHVAKAYPKIALGGVARIKGAVKHNWAKECFARVWPKKVHGFGYGTEKDVLGLPWHSTDSTNWELGPCAFGRWKSYAGGSKTGIKLNVRGSRQNLRGEVEWYLDLEERARNKWRPQMEELGADAGNDPKVRLAIIGSGRESRTLNRKRVNR